LTALTAQNTLGVSSIHQIPLEFIEAQFDSIMTDIGAQAAKTGMLWSAEVVKLIARKVKQYQLKLIVDPVMV